MTYTVRPLDAALWRMLPIRFQRDPYSGEGARRHGGRWNAVGRPALYLALDHATAVAEFYQGLPKPGTLAPYHLAARAVADLTDGRGGPADAAIADALAAAWKRLALDGVTPPGWALAERLVAMGADGALVPSVQNRGGTNLILWRWHAAGGAGEGGRLTLLDPEAALG